MYKTKKSSRDKEHQMDISIIKGNIRMKNCTENAIVFSSSMAHKLHEVFRIEFSVNQIKKIKETAKGTLHSNTNNDCYVALRVVPFETANN